MRRKGLQGAFLPCSLQGMRERLFLTVKEAAEVVGVHHKTIYRSMARGKGPPHHKFNGSGTKRGIYRIRREDLEKWIEERRCSA